MSQGILMEVDFFINSLIVGVIITFAYDWLLILRKCIRHNIIFISIEDLIFWLVCAMGVFYVLYHENNGILRWFAVFGATIGMFIYKKLLSQSFVNVTSAIIIKAFKILLKPLLFMCRKILRLLRKIFMFLQKKYIFINAKSKKINRIAKKKLTLQAKLVKIYLCKHEKQLGALWEEKAHTVKKDRIN
ncbi:MAG: spore cortex biosynthesis protein YabQ [Lachnospiraceae bacterium]|nr:spore cortex biosynthesis protein YabQ [Lachnospiraceae bacterium]